MTAPGNDSPVDLARENAALNEQVKLLVRTEHRLYRSRRGLDAQLRQMQALERFALDSASGLDPHEILTRAVAALDGLFSFDWCVVGELHGGNLHVLVSSTAFANAQTEIGAPELCARLEGEPAVATLRLPGELDPTLLDPLWPPGARRPEATSESWLVCFKLAEGGAPAPAWLLAHAPIRSSFSDQLSTSRGDAGHSFLSLFAAHLERALENAWLNQALRQRSAELTESLAELERTQARLTEATRMESIGRLAGGVAHDFNNLLTVISGHAALMADGLRPDDPGRAHAAKLATAVEKAAGITAQLLAFGRRQILTRVALDLNEVVTATTQMLGRLIGEHVEVQLHLEASLPPVVADRVRVDQVLLNLLVNARDALPDGGTIRVSTRAAGARDLARVRDEAPVGEYVLLEVCDDGLGMDAAVQGRIFEPFFSTKDPGQGAGLGLSVVYGIVRQSEGYLFVESSPGKGATFGVLLPVSRATPDPDPGKPAGRATLRGGARILLVEDEPMIRDIARSFLTRAGHDVVEAGNGREALEHVKANPAEFDLLLTDVVMPVMGGLALARELRRSSPGLRVMFMSGYAQELAIGGAEDATHDYFLGKPFTSAKLLEAVSSALAASPGRTT